MDSQRTAAYLLLGGVVFMAAAFGFGLRGIYETDDLNARVQIIETNQTRWYVSQSMYVVSIILTAAGFFVLNMWMYGLESDSWPYTLGAGAMIIGGIAGVVFVVRQTLDPLSSYQGAFSAFESVYSWLSVGGLMLFGVAFLQAGFPNWLGYLTVAATGLFAIFLAAMGVTFLTPGLIFVLSLVIGIWLLRQ